jgi:glutathione S-transferase
MTENFKLKDKQLAQTRLNRIKEIFEIFSDKLKQNGGRYLTGPHLSYIDISFCSIGALVVLPENYGGGALPVEMSMSNFLDRLGEDYLELMKEMKLTPSGAFVARMYEEERLKKVYKNE